MSSYSTNARCIGPSRRTALITIGGELTWRSTKTHRSPEEYSLQQRVLWWSFVKWAVCIITTNAAPPNTHPIRRQHRIECPAEIRRLRVPSAPTPRSMYHSALRPLLSIDEPTEILPPLSRRFGFFVGTVYPRQPETSNVAGRPRLRQKPNALRRREKCVIIR
jgi:hypothetical protein